MTQDWTNIRNTSMKVFSQLFVGIRDEGKAVPLGFATPYENTAAGRKRQETVLSWAGRKKPKTSIIENIPVPGFKITDDVKRVYWGGGNVVWRVEDPRGFELEIQSNNLMALIQSCGIGVGGVITGNCIWGRAGGDNILLHETSDEYKDAIKAAETLKPAKQISKVQRQVGKLYRLVNGSHGVYLGKVHVTTTRYEDSDSDQHRIVLPGGQFITGVSTRFTIEPSVEFEAVLDVCPETRVPGMTLRLYKKAPLVIDQEVSIALPKITDDFLRELDWKFASSSFVGRIMSVTTEPISNPEGCLVPLPKSRFKQKLSAINAAIASNDLNYAAAQILSYHNDEAVMIDDALCCSISMIGSNNPSYARESQSEPTYFIGTPLVMAKDKIVTSAVTYSHRNPLLKVQPSSWTWAHDAHKLCASAPLQVTRLPVLSVADDVKKLTMKLYEENKLFLITAREARKK